MKKKYGFILAILVIASFSISAREFPEQYDFPLMSIGPDWSAETEHAEGYRDRVFETHKGPLTLQVQVFSSPMNLRNVVPKFVAALPEYAEYEIHEETAEDYWGDEITIEFVTGTVTGRRFHARKITPDNTPVMIVVYVPIDMENDYMDEIQNILY